MKKTTKGKAEPKLGPCPFCGRRTVNLQLQNSSSWAVHCNYCGALGPLVASPEMASELWTGMRKAT
jgi:transcription elongation factor Elf1